MINNYPHKEITGLCWEDPANDPTKKTCSGAGNAENEDWDDQPQDLISFI